MARVFRLNLNKNALRKLHDTTVNEHAEKFLARLLTDGRVKRGWHGHVEDFSVEDARVVTEEVSEDGTKTTTEKDGFKYNLDFYVTCRSKRGRLDEVVEKEVGEIQKVLERTSRAKGWNSSGVFVKMPEDFTYPGVLPPIEEKADSDESVKEVNLNEVQPDVVHCGTETKCETIHEHKVEVPVESVPV